MKIFCDVQLINRLASANTQNRSQKSTLAIGTTPKDDSQVFILHFTNTNKTGTRYNLKDNLENVFCKFVHEGKATIRFKTPPQDMCIKCESTQLKSFLKTLRCSMSGQVPKKEMALSNITATSITKKMQPLKKLIIANRAQYPTKGFPRTLEHLSIAGLKLERFETQIIQLRNLTVLDLSNNCLKRIPPSLGNMPNLAELNLNGNKLCESKLYEWEWLNRMAIRKSLKTLHLSQNGLIVLPDNIVQLHALISLKVDNNLLQMLPNGIKRLRKLQSLFVNCNKLRYLPYSIYQLNLNTLDVSFNCFEMRKFVLSHNRITMTLGELCARTILKYDIKYSPTLIPKTMCQYLDASTECICSKSIVDKYCSFVSLISKRLADSFIYDTTNVDRRMPIKIDMCSQKCFKPFVAEILANN